MKTKGLNVVNTTSANQAGPIKGTAQDIKVLSLDAETNGLWGTAFQIAAVLYDHGTVITFNGQCPIECEINPWVKDNVLPYVDGVMYRSYYLLLKDFMEWYKAHKEDADVIVHVGLPVEARLFIDAHNYGFIGDWDAPFPLIDISAIPEIGTSVDNYNKKHSIKVPYKGNIHNALYDSWAALVAYLNTKKQ